MNPLISIIVPVYNAEETLPRCVDSLLAQTCGELEIILVDDGSRDGSGALCAKYAEANDRIIAISKKNGGVSSARNAGIRAAHGRYLGFVDSDDWIMPEMYAALHSAIVERGVQISACGYSIHKYDGTVTDEMVDPSTPPVLELHSALSSLIHPRGIQGFLCNKLFDRELIVRLGGGSPMLLDERIHVCEDLLYVSRCAEAAGSIAYDSRPMYIYCVRDYGGAENYNRERRVSELIALELLADSWSGLSAELGSLMKRKYTLDAYYIFRSVAAAGDREYYPVMRAHVRRYLGNYLKSGEVSAGKKLRALLSLPFPNLENRLKAVLRK